MDTSYKKRRTQAILESLKMLLLVISVILSAETFRLSRSNSADLRLVEKESHEIAIKAAAQVVFDTEGFSVTRTPDGATIRPLKHRP